MVGFKNGIKDHQVGFTKNSYFLHGFGQKSRFADSLVKRVKKIMKINLIYAFQVEIPVYKMLFLRGFKIENK